MRRRAPLTALAALVASLAGARADAEEPFQLKGFVASEYLFSDGVDGAALAPLVPALPASRASFELNLQPRLRLGGRALGLAADVSLYLSTREPRHLVLINEAYLSWQLSPALRVLVGRRRVIWGPGVAANPTDLVNPPKNLLDPQQQRTGAFMVPLVEISGERVTLSALLSPGLATDPQALPTQFDYTRSIVGGRIYSLILDTDLNLLVMRKLRQERTYVGASFSRFLGQSVEIHAEGVVWSGPPETPAFILPACWRAQGEERLRGSLVAGLRHDWSDQTFLSLEYLYQGTGLDDDDFRMLPAAAACSRSAAAAMGIVAEPPNPIGHPVEPPLALLRQHYAVAVFQRPHLGGGALDDLALAATLVYGPADTSLVWQLKLTYKVGERGELGLGDLVAHSVEDDGELRQWPTRTVVFVDMKLYY